MDTSLLYTGISMVIIFILLSFLFLSAKMEDDQFDRMIHQVWEYLKPMSTYLGGAGLLLYVLRYQQIHTVAGVIGIGLISWATYRWAVLKYEFNFKEIPKEES